MRMLQCLRGAIHTCTRSCCVHIGHLVSCKHFTKWFECLHAAVVDSVQVCCVNILALVRVSIECYVNTAPNPIVSQVAIYRKVNIARTHTIRDSHAEALRPLCKMFTQQVVSQLHGWPSWYMASRSPQ